MAKAAIKPKSSPIAQRPKPSPKAAAAAPEPAKREAAPVAHKTEMLAGVAPKPATMHQRVLSNEEVAENAARERGAPAAAAFERDESPKVTGFRLMPDDRAVHVDDEVVLRTPNPIEGQTINRAIVTKVNADSTINVKVEIGGKGGLLRQFSSVRNEITEDRSPFWNWPEEPAKT